jgi:site-specific DNA recombinase
MISLRKPICLRKPPRPQPSAVPTANYAGLSLAKGPRPSHPQIICVKGKSAGGRSYGYRVDRQPLPDGTWTTGDLTIKEDEASVICRIFKDYDQGQSARSIAIALNAEGVPSPNSGKTSGEWTFSTVQGNWKRGTGILNNELYVGMRVWNRQYFVNHPETGKRQARLNPEEEWTRNPVPELRILDEDLWTRVKDRQGSIRANVLEARSKNDNPLN